jgi:hypothetical protein
VSRAPFSAVRSEGGLLPGDLLVRVGAGDKKLPGTDPASYGLLPHETPGEAINRAWARLVGAWRAFRSVAEPDTTLTRERWLLPLFQELGYGRLSAAKAVEVDGKVFAVSHAWERAPVHLVSARYELDKRVPGVKGAAMSSPHGLLQDLLNRSEAHLWGFVSNGRELRILRDHHSLTQVAYVEFDLEQIFDGELYSEFRLLWLVCHATRVQGEKAGECILERWFEGVQKEGVAALDKLRDGVEQAITALGTGFLRHPGNGELRRRLETGELSTLELYRQLLRLVYQLIFVFVAEDRGLLLDPAASPEARALYTSHYATRRLRTLADRKRGGLHGDLWVWLRLVLGKLYGGYRPLGLPAFGSFLWRSVSTAAISGCELANEHLLEAIRSLNTLREGGLRRQVAWHLVAADELGSVYESLMELHPMLNAETFSLEVGAGNERKTTGAYYTPPSLVECLLDNAIDPLLDEACLTSAPEQALLALKVLDPACGSGHCLVAAARRIAWRLARVRSGDVQPAPPDYRRALRDVVGRCVYGVDINEMSIELCKIALWMEAIEPGKPLSFLDSHIQVGNSLLGATPMLLARGVPDDAWTAITGDDPKVAKALKKRNQEERIGQGRLFEEKMRAFYKNRSEEARAIEEAPAESLPALERKEAGWSDLNLSSASLEAKFHADLWCSAFFWPKVEPHQAGAPTFERFYEGGKKVPWDLVEGISTKCKLFHWDLAFPAVFTPDLGEENKYAGWAGGFEAVIGNVPWELVTIKEKEWFAKRNPQIWAAPTAHERKKKIEALQDEEPELHAEFMAASRDSEGYMLFLAKSGRYPLCGRGSINLYAVFAEATRSLLREYGRSSCIIPTGIATDDSTKGFFRDIVESGYLVSLFDFENKGLFKAVHNSYKFCVLTGGLRPERRPIEFVFFAHDPNELREPGRRFVLTAEDFERLNPNTRTCPIFRTRRDAEITKAIYRKVPVLWREDESAVNSWSVSFKRMFDMTNDSDLFHNRKQLETEGWRLDGNVFVRNGARMLPLYEAKMFHQFDHRFNDSEQNIAGTLVHSESIERRTDASYHTHPRYWIDEVEVNARLPDHNRLWLLAWRDICRSTDFRTTILGVLPRSAVGNTAPLMISGASPELVSALYTSACSFIFDYVSRQKIGGTHLNYLQLKQLPVLPPATYTQPTPWDPATTLADWIRPRVLELTYTAWDLTPFARDLGWHGPPFRWDEERRFLLRAELDAAFFHLYGISRADVDYIMETFPIVRKHDEKAHNGAYRTKDAILAIYDAMAQAIDTHVAYQDALEPATVKADVDAAHRAWPDAPARQLQLVSALVHDLQLLLPFLRPPELSLVQGSPDERASLVRDVLARVEPEEIVQQLPEPLRRSLGAG